MASGITPADFSWMKPMLKGDLEAQSLYWMLLSLLIRLAGFHFSNVRLHCAVDSIVSKVKEADLLNLKSVNVAMVLCGLEWPSSPIPCSGKHASGGSFQMWVL